MVDFLVGGLPRGGTTATSRLTSEAEGAWCYSAESHLVREILEFAGERPVPKIALDRVIDAINTSNVRVLQDMALYNIRRGARPENFIFHDGRLARLRESIGKVLGGGLFGAEAVIAVMSAFAGIVSEDKKVDKVGEKTPPNSISMARYPALLNIPAAHVIREPFSAFSSSARRAIDENDRFNSAFSTELVPNIGAYMEYAEAIALVTAHPCSAFFRYEDAADDPIVYAEKVCTHLGLTLNEVGKRGAGNLFSKPEKLHKLSEFAPAEVAVTRTILREHLERFGYDDDFYGQELENSLENIDGNLSDRVVIEPLFGFDVLKGRGLIARQRHCKLIVFARPDVSGFKVQMQSVNMKALGYAGDAIDLSVRVGQSIENISLDPAGLSSRIDFDIDEKDWVWLGSREKCVIVEFDHSHLFRPILDLEDGADRVARGALVNIR